MKKKKKALLRAVPGNRNGSPPRMVQCNVTPDKAVELLSTSRGNRPLKPSHLSKIKQAMRSGKFGLSHVPIGITESGHLCDGHHRLTACVETGVTFSSWICHGVKEEEIAGGIQVESHRLSDYLLAYSQEPAVRRLLGDFGDTKISHINFVANEVSAIFTYLLTPNEKKPAFADGDAIVRYFEKELAWALRYVFPKDLVRRAVVALAFMLFHKAHSKRANEFLEAVWTDTEHEEGSPALVLRRYLLAIKERKGFGKPSSEHKSDSQITIFYKTLLAMRAFCEDETLRSLRPPRAGSSGKELLSYFFPYDRDKKCEEILGYAWNDTLKARVVDPKVTAQIAEKRILVALAHRPCDVLQLRTITQASTEVFEKALSSLVKKKGSVSRNGRLCLLTPALAAE